MEVCYQQGAQNGRRKRFEELAGVIATAYAYLEEDRGREKMLTGFQHSYRRALEHPPYYTDRKRKWCTAEGGCATGFVGQPPSAGADFKSDPCYSEINEITGQSLSSGDRMAGQSAWTLQKIEGMRIYGVHSLLARCRRNLHCTADAREHHRASYRELTMANKLNVQFNDLQTSRRWRIWPRRWAPPRRAS